MPSAPRFSPDCPCCGTRCNPCTCVNFYDPNSQNVVSEPDVMQIYIPSVGGCAYPSGGSATSLTTIGDSIVFFGNYNVIRDTGGHPQYLTYSPAITIDNYNAGDIICPSGVHFLGNTSFCTARSRYDNLTGNCLTVANPCVTGVNLCLNKDESINPCASGINICGSGHPNICISGVNPCVAPGSENDQKCYGNPDEVTNATVYWNILAYPNNPNPTGLFFDFSDVTTPLLTCPTGYHLTLISGVYYNCASGTKSVIPTVFGNPGLFCFNYFGLCSIDSCTCSSGYECIQYPYCTTFLNISWSEQAAMVGVNWAVASGICPPCYGAYPGTATSSGIGSCNISVPYQFCVVDSKFAVSSHGDGLPPFGSNTLSQPGFIKGWMQISDLIFNNDDMKYHMGDDDQPPFDTFLYNFPAYKVIDGPQPLPKWNSDLYVLDCQYQPISLCGENTFTIQEPELIEMGGIVGSICATCERDVCCGNKLETPALFPQEDITIHVATSSTFNLFIPFNPNPQYSETVDFSVSFTTSIDYTYSPIPPVGNGCDTGFSDAVRYLYGCQDAHVLVPVWIFSHTCGLPTVNTFSVGHIPLQAAVLGINPDLGTSFTQTFISCGKCTTSSWGQNVIAVATVGWLAQTCDTPIVGGSYPSGSNTPCFDSAGNFTGYANESPDGNCGCTKICTTGPRTCYFGQTVGTLFGPAAAGGIAAFNAYGCRGSGVIDLCNGIISMNLYNNCPPGGSNTLMGTLDL